MPKPSVRALQIKTTFAVVRWSRAAVALLANEVSDPLHPRLRSRLVSAGLRLKRRLGRRDPIQCNAGKPSSLSHISQSTRDLPIFGERPKCTANRESPVVSTRGFRTRGSINSSFWNVWTFRHTRLTTSLGDIFISAARFQFFTCWLSVPVPMERVYGCVWDLSPIPYFWAAAYGPLGRFRRISDWMINHVFIQCYCSHYFSRFGIINSTVHSSPIRLPNHTAVWVLILSLMSFLTPACRLEYFSSTVNTHTRTFGFWDQGS